MVKFKVEESAHDASCPSRYRTGHWGAMPSATDNSHGQGETLEQWMKGYQQADKAAAGKLIASLSPRLLRFFRHQGARPAEAEDLLQDTWLRIHRVRHSYRPCEPFLPWAYSIARRVRVDHYRRNRRLVISEIPLDDIPDPSGSERRALPTFESLVDRLPAEQREVVIMLKLEGLSVAEVARITSSTSGAVKQKAHRAYRSLRRLLVGHAEKKGGIAGED